MTLENACAFASRKELNTWLKQQHAVASELWVQIYKKDSGRPSVNWQDCVVLALTWGWIDGQKRANDAESFFQRLTPRRPKSNWSKRNCELAEQLIAAGEMQAAGLAHVTAAQSDGRWAQAYAGSAQMTFPEDFLSALKAVPAAEACFATLNRQQLFSIYHRLHTARRADTRANRIAIALAALAEGKAPFRS